jgi:hypothetical protein
MRLAMLFFSVFLASTALTSVSFAFMKGDRGGSDSCPEPPCAADCPEPPCVISPEGIPPGISKSDVSRCLKTSIHPSGDVEKNPLLACLKEACKKNGGDDLEACMKGSETFVVNLKDDGTKFEGGGKFSLGRRGGRTDTGKGSIADDDRKIADDDRKVDGEGRLKFTPGAIIPVMMPNGTPPVPISDPK